MWNNQSPISKKISGMAMMLLGVLLLVFGALWVVSLLIAIVAFWLINTGMLLWGAPSLWSYIQRAINTIRQNIA